MRNFTRYALRNEIVRMLSTLLALPLVWNSRKQDAYSEGMRARTCNKASMCYKFYMNALYVNVISERERMFCMLTRFQLCSRYFLTYM